MKVCPTCHACYEDADPACVDATHAALIAARPGKRLVGEKYLLERLIGRGGMGAVYEARHTGLERAVAVKLLRHDYLEDSHALERFRREARAVARIRHPNVADIYDFGVLSTGEPYIAMELVPGETLRRLLDRVGPLPIADAARIGRQLSDGVEAAHRSGVVHRDLKPSNVVLLSSDHAGAPQAKVLDFSIAKLDETLATGKEALTTEGAFLGTPQYMSPEQCDGQPLDARSDVYGLGVLIYEMLAGRPPFEGRGAAAIALKQLQDAPPPLQRLRADVPEPLAWLVMQALHKKPDFRPQSAAEVAERLRPFEEPEPRAAPVSPSESAGVPAPLSLVTAEIPADTLRLPDGPDAPAPPEAVGLADALLDRPLPFAAREARALPPVPQPFTPASAPPPPPTEREGEIPSPPLAEPTGHTYWRSFPTEARAGRAAPPRAALVYGGVAAALVAAAAVGWLVVKGPAGDSPRARQGTRVAQARPSISPAPARPVPAATGRTSSAPPTAVPPRESDPLRERDLPSATAAKENTGPADSPPSETARREPARSPASVPASKREPAPAGEPALRRALGGWIATTNAADVSGHMVFYMPTIRRFYMTRNVPRSFVRAEKARLFQRATRIDVTAGDPDIETARDGRTATMRFRKRYVIEGPRVARRGEVEQELVWVQTGDGWKIVGERDARVIR